MTAIVSTTGQRFSLKSDADVAALKEAMRTDIALQDAVDRFNPGIGQWLVPDGTGGYVRDAQGEYLLETLTADDMRRYHDAFAAIDRSALDQLRQRQAQEAATATAEYHRKAAGFKGSTGEPWEAEDR